MSVRAKFKLESYETRLTTRQIDPHKGYHDENMQHVEIRTLKFLPVYGNGDPKHENTRFYAWTPSGELTLGCVNPEAWALFELGKEYYLDFTPAE